DILLSQVDVSLLGRSHVLSVKAESRNPATAASVANTLADTYLDYQRKEKIATLDRVDKFLLGRISELREQVRKSDQAVEDYRRSHGLYKSNNSSGVTTQQLTELNTQLIQAQTAKAEAESRLAEARYQALSQNIEKLKGQMGQVNDQSIGLEALERDAVVNRNLLEAMLNRVKQSSGAEDILQANAKLVSPAAPGEAPTYPPKTL